MQIFFAPVVDGHLQGTMLSMCIYHISYPFAAMRCSMLDEEPSRMLQVDHGHTPNVETSRIGITHAIKCRYPLKILISNRENTLT